MIDNQDDLAPPTPAKSLRRPIWTGLIVLGLFIGGLAAWSWLAPLAGATIASGAISPEGYRRTVQHLEGGIVEDILVRDGDLVQPGSPLIVLRDVQARAMYDQLEARNAYLSAVEERLLAEENGQSIWIGVAELLPASDPMRELLAGQERLFDLRRQHLDEQSDILSQRVGQLRTQIEGLQQQIASQDTQVELIGQEVENVETLLERGLERLPRLLALQRAMAELEGARAGNVAAIATAEERIGETELELVNLETEHLQAVSDQLLQVQAERAQIEDQLAASADVLARTIIPAPIGGTIVGLRVRTSGGVISPGEPILDIVPLNEALLIEAQIAVTDIDTVALGQPARIHLSAYPQRNLQPLDGEVVALSADSMADEQTRIPYYAARISVATEALESLPPDVELRPGMPAEVFITTDARTVIDYLLSPFISSFNRAFRES